MSGPFTFQRLFTLGVLYVCSLSATCAQLPQAKITTLVATGDLGGINFDPIVKEAKTAKIIALSESNHGKNEPLNFRNALIKALIQKRLIDVVALESGTIEGKLLYDYVLNASDTTQINWVLKQGFSWRFYVIPQNEELVTWLRTYNADKNNTHKVKLYGFDMPGSPGNPNVSRRMTTAFDYALNYLKSVDNLSYQHFSQTIEPLLPFLHIDFDNPSTKDVQFSQLQESERIKLLAICGQLISHLQTHELKYSASSSKQDFEWAYLAAMNSQQIVNWLNYIPVGYVPPSENNVLVNSDIFHLIFNYRDRAMFDNVNWIVNREPSSRIFIFASTNHLLKKPIVLVDPKSSVHQKNTLGNYLDLRYGKNYFLIANIISNNSLDEATSIENVLLNKQFEHYYTPLSTFKPNSHDWTKLYYQTNDTRIDLFQSADMVLFDKQQTNIKFRQ